MLQIYPYLVSYMVGDGGGSTDLCCYSTAQIIGRDGRGGGSQEMNGVSLKTYCQATDSLLLFESYRISPLISCTSLLENSLAKNGMQLTFEIIVKSTVRQSDSQTVRQSDSQTVRQSDSQTVRQSDMQLQMQYIRRLMSWEVFETKW